MHEVNLLAVLVAGFVPMIVGMLWYGPLFGKRWLAMMETTAEEIQEGFNPLKTYGVSFLLALLTAYILAQLIEDSGGSALVGAHVGLLALVGFVLPVAHQSVAFEKRKAGLAWLNVAYNGVALVGQAVVVAVWR
ncbi:MAG: DUF1761 domain-containing protein [Gemmatimonadetes bacterium]|nr:DUF1761 domain-containing protein [Gemmatimonadota bacterium]